MDIAIAWNQQLGQGDWEIADGDLLTGPALWSAVAVSLFSEQGWWADAYADTPIGSTLPQLPTTPKSGGTDLLLQARDAVLAALAWMITDGVAAAVDCQPYWIAPTAIGLPITITAASGSTSSETFSWAWSEF